MYQKVFGARALIYSYRASKYSEMLVMHFYFSFHDNETDEFMQKITIRFQKVSKGINYFQKWCF